MKFVRNENGIAMVTTLMLTLISLTMILSLLYIITQGITTSAAHKRYQTSLQAAKGGVDIFSKEIIPRLLKGDLATEITNDFNGTGGISLNISSSDCLSQKLSQTSSGWSSCGPQSMSIEAKTDYDVSFKLTGLPNQPGYTVYSKIVDTTPGNSDSSGIDYLESGSGVTGVGSGVSPKHIPYVYRIEVQGESERNTKERAKLSVLYAY